MDFFNLPALSMLQAVAYFAKSGSVSQAAQAMGISNAHLQQHFHALEAQLGQQLFERRDKHLVFTETGKVLAEDLVSGFSTITNGLRKSAGIVRPASVCITTPPCMSFNFLMGLLPKFRQKFPDIKVTLNPLAIGEDLVSWDSDLLISAVGVGERPDRCDYLFSSELSLVATKNLIRQYVKQGVTKLPLVIDERQAEAGHGIELQSFLEVHNGSVETLSEYECLPMILSGRAAGVIDSYLVREQLANHSLTRLKVLGPRRDYVIMHKTQFPDIPVTSLVTWLANELNPDPEPV
jgi:LysR family glycine cleavage system transcriptional activator